MIYRFLVTQPHLNAHGTLHGGILMKWVDEVCGIEARLLSKSVVATRHIKEIDFQSTVRLGDIVEVVVRRVETRRTSMTFTATVRDTSGTLIANFERVVFVAVDELHRPIPVERAGSDV